MNKHDTSSVLFEACVTSVPSAVAAQRGGARRVELCDNLHDGGTTPGPGSIAVARRALDIGLHVIVRPRGGDFLYTDLEFEIMKQEVVHCRETDCDGVVFGILRADGTVDRERNAQLVDLAGNLSTTFHRAFDMTRDPRAALEELVDLGLDRVLTSGQKPSAPAGARLIGELVEQAAGRIGILPGAGITAANVGDFLRSTGAREFHAHLSAAAESRMEYLNPDVFMGTDPDLSEYEIEETTEQQVRELVAAARRAVDTPR